MRPIRVNPIQYMKNVRRRSRSDVRQPFPGHGPGYAMNDPNAFPQDFAYREDLVFGGQTPIDLAAQGFNPTAALNLTLQQLNSPIAPIQPASPNAPAAPAAFKNNDDFSLFSFVVGTVSVQVLNQNYKRSGLIIQNLSATANMWFSFGAAASQTAGVELAAGQGFFFDTVVPNDSIYVIFDAAAQNGIVAEAMRP